MKKVAFVTHSFHKKTNSANIYAEEIFNRNIFLIDYFYVDGWTLHATGLNSEIVDYDIVIILQSISLELLSKIKCDNIIFMPMYDFSYNWDVFKWLECFNLKILSMTKTLHNTLSQIGLNSFYAKYYPEPLEYLPGDLKKIFLWQRINDIHIDTALKLLNGFPIEKIHLHKAVDPYHTFVEPCAEKISKYNIIFSEWFENREQYIDTLKETGIYIAPRLMEGGASAFIDGMKMGKIVIANNDGAMNEYITHNETGFLYDAHNVQPIDLNSIDLIKIQQNAYESVREGRLAWKNSISEILNFFESKNSTLLQNKTIHAIHQSREELRKEQVTLAQRIDQVESELHNSKWHNFGKLSRKDKVRKIFKTVLKKILALPILKFTESS